MTDFQDRFDGESLIYPPTRAAHVGMTATLPPAVTGGLTVSGGDTITAGTAGALANIPLGAIIRLSGSGLGNEGEYTVVSNDGTAITIAGTLTAGTASMTVSGSINDGAEPGATLSVANWYAGDEVAASHRVEGERTLSLSLNGIDPAFEKAIRAMGMIAQGEYGTAGGLEQNLDRVDHALALLDSALERASGAGEPLGPELAGSIETVRMDLGFDLAVVNETRERQKALAVGLDNQIGEIENVDPLEALTKLLDDGRALEASYQVVARIREFSLMNYL